MKEQAIAQFQTVFGRAPEVITRAPGRIEFIGNHTDYNGGTVFGAAINRCIWVAVARRTDGRRRFFSPIAPGVIELPAGEPTRQSGDASWANYPLGVIAALPSFGLKQPGGFDYLAISDLPPGAGLSSSAAIEMSSSFAFLALTGETPSLETTVKVAKHAENNFVGVPCGILDQGVSGFGKKDHLVFIDCKGPRFDTSPLPANAHFWIFNTHTKHALVDGFYAARHRECMTAAKELGVAVLADVPAVGLDERLKKLDPIVAQRARHVVEEIARVEATRVAVGVGDLAAVGKLLTASHRSSQTLFENSTEELDALVDILTAVPEVFGARLTGGGFGGAVMALTDGRFNEAHAAAVAGAYEKRYGAKPEIFHLQTGPGAELL